MKKIVEKISVIEKILIRQQKFRRNSKIETRKRSTANDIVVSDAPKYYKFYCSKCKKFTYNTEDCKTKPISEIQKTDTNNFFKRTDKNATLDSKT